MKKRILSLILAFAMAATLAPATALVGTSVSKAAVTGATLSASTLDLVKGESDSTITLTLAKDSGADAANVSFDTSKAGGITAVVDGAPDTTTATAPVYKIKLSATTTAAGGPVDVYVNRGEADVQKKTITVTTKSIPSTAQTVTPTTKETGNGAEIAKVAGWASFSDGYDVTVDRGIADGEFNIIFTVGGALNADNIKSIKFTRDSTQTGNHMDPSGVAIVDSANKHKATVKMTGVNTTVPGTYGYNVDVYRQADAANSPSWSTKITITVTKQWKVTYNIGTGTITKTTGGNYDDPEANMVSPGVHAFWINDDKAVALATVTRPGYEFDGFTKVLNGTTTNIDATTTTDDIVGDVTYTAKWKNSAADLVLNINTVDTSAISVENNSHTNVWIPAEIGSKIPTNVFRFPGWTFAGWTTIDGGGIVEYNNGATITEELLKKVGADAQLYAIWRQDALTVNFAANVPEGSTLSSASGVMETINVPARTPLQAVVDTRAAFENKFVVAGKKFVGWSHDKDGRDMIGDDHVNYTRAIVNPNGEAKVTLYAQWTDAKTSMIIYNLEAGASGNTVSRVVYDTVAAPSAFDPPYPGKFGYEMSSNLSNIWTYADKTVVSGNVEYDDNGIASIYPIYTASKMPITYVLKGTSTQVDIGEATKGSHNMKVTGVKRTEIDITSGNITLPKATIEYETVRGWRVKELAEITDVYSIAAMKADGFDKDAVYTNSFNAKEILQAIAWYSPVEVPSITMELVSYVNIAGAKILDASVTNSQTARSYEYNNKTTTVIPYGTAQSTIETALRSKIKIVEADAASIGAGASIYTDLSSQGLENSLGSGDVVKWTVSPAYNPYPKNNVATYTFTGTVIGDPNVYGNGGSPVGTQIYAKVYVKSKDANDEAKYVTKVNQPADINLSGDAEPNDIINAYQSFGYVTVTADNGKTYNVKVRDLSAATLQGDALDATNVASGSFKLYDDQGIEITSPANTYGYENIAQALECNVKKFTARFDLPVTTTGDEIVATDGTKLKVMAGLTKVAITVNIGAASTNPEKDKDDVIAAEVEKAKEFLAQGYSIRMYDKNRGEHIYSAGIAEVEMLLKAGWTQETTEKNSFKMSTVKTELYDTAIYRVYNKNNGGAHMFTKNKAEAQNAVNHGWTWDNKGEPVFYVSNDPTKGTKVYRALNPNKKSGEHAWSVSKAEHDNLIKVHKWIDESTDNNVWYSPN